MAELVRYDAARTALAEAHRVDEVKSIPHCPGVYFFRDANDAILYVGRSKDLRKRLTQSHHRAYLLRDRATKLFIIKCSNHEQAERLLIGYVKPIHNYKAPWLFDPIEIARPKKSFDEVYDFLFGDIGWVSA